MARTGGYGSFSTSDLLGLPVQQSTRPRLPSIRAISTECSTVDDDSRRSMQLPPLRMPHPTSPSPTRRISRESISVPQLLSSQPPSPRRSQHSGSNQQLIRKTSPSGNIAKSSSRNGTQPSQFSNSPAHMFGMAHVRTGLAQPLPSYAERPSYFQYHSHLYGASNSISPIDHVRPATSTASSPPGTFSEPSRRPSIGDQSQSGSTICKISQTASPALNFHLSIRQQPIAARACGFGERDRRVIDPPPILGLKITDQAHGFPASDPDGMLALNCTLWSSDGQADETKSPGTTADIRAAQKLMGTLVASPYQAKDEHGVAGSFFVFPDMSCRSPGEYRLCFKLLRVEPMNLSAGGRSVATIVSDVFRVYTAKDFPGMRASSALLQALRRQGLNVGVKKGSEARKTKGKTRKTESPATSSAEDEVVGDADTRLVRQHSKPRARKRKKRRRAE